MSRKKIVAIKPTHPKPGKKPHIVRICGVWYMRPSRNAKGNIMASRDIRRLSGIWNRVYGGR